MLTGVPEELQSPQELDNVEDAQKAWVGQVEEIVVGVTQVGEAEVLEEEEHAESPQQDQEEEDVKKVVWILEEEPDGVF